MMRFSVAFVLTFALLGPVAADTRAAVEEHILPRYAAFAEAARALSDTAAVDCSASGMTNAYHSAYDTWMSISHIQFGPIETRGVALALAFWPDPKDRTGKAITLLLAEDVVPDSETFKDVSIAAQGFPALERLLTETQPDTAASCALKRAIARYIAEVAEDLNTDWQTGYAAGFAMGDIPPFQTPAEARRALYTALSTSLVFIHDTRLGRPLGTFDRPRPNRAEARRSGRSQRHVVLSLVGALLHKSV
jgi:predicted lipoprotein